MAQMIEGEEESGAGILVMIHKPRPGPRIFLRCNPGFHSQRRSERGQILGRANEARGEAVEL